MNCMAVASSGRRLKQYDTLYISLSPPRDCNPRQSPTVPQINQPTKANASDCVKYEEMNGQYGLGIVDSRII